MVTKYPMLDEFELEQMGMTPGKRIYYLVYKDDKLIHKRKMGTINSWAHSHSLTYPEELPVELQQEFVEQYAKEVGFYESIADAIFQDESLYLIVMTRSVTEWKGQYDWLKKQAVRDKFDELVEECNQYLDPTIKKIHETIQIDCDRSMEPEEILELLTLPKPEIKCIDVAIKIMDEDGGTKTDTKEVEKE